MSNFRVAPPPVCPTNSCFRRVKAIDILAVAAPPYAEASAPANYASTVSSDGYIRVYDLHDVVRGSSVHATEQPVIIEPVTHYDTKGSRLTCVAMADGEMTDDPKVAGGKRKRREESVEELPEAEHDSGEEADSDAEDEDEDQSD